MNQAEPVSIDQIKDKLKESKINPLELKELYKFLDEIYKSKQKYENNQSVSRLQTLENDLSEISNLLTDLFLEMKKKSGLINYFKQNSQIQEAQLKCSQKIRNVYYETVKYEEVCPLITTSTYTKEKQMIDTDYIEISTNIKINHPMIIPIKQELNLMLKQGIYQDLYEIDILRRFLMIKIKEKQINNLDKDQLKYIEQFFEKKPNYQLFKAEYSISSKISAITSEIFPYVITTYKNQNIIYLCEGMRLKFFPNHFLTVLETNTKNQDLDNFSSSTDIDGKCKGILKIPDYGYIKFSYSGIDQDLSQNQNQINQEQQSEQRQKTSEEGKTYEFYLKNQEIFLFDHIPQINAKLFHCKHGFYILPEKTPVQNYYYNCLENLSMIIPLVLIIKFVVKIYEFYIAFKQKFMITQLSVSILQEITTNKIQRISAWNSIKRKRMDLN